MERRRRKGEREKIPFWTHLLIPPKHVGITSSCNKEMSVAFPFGSAQADRARAACVSVVSSRSPFLLG